MTGSIPEEDAELLQRAALLSFDLERLMALQRGDMKRVAELDYCGLGTEAHAKLIRSIKKP